VRSGKTPKNDENEFNSNQGRPIEKPIGALKLPWIGEGAKQKKSNFFLEIGEVWKKLF
jgi:hypothetical protein